MIPTFAPDLLENIVRKLPRGLAVNGKEGPDGRPFDSGGGRRRRQSILPGRWPGRAILCACPGGRRTRCGQPRRSAKRRIQLPPAQGNAWPADAHGRWSGWRRSALRGRRGGGGPRRPVDRRLAGAERRSELPRCARFRRDAALRACAEPLDRAADGALADGSDRGGEGRLPTVPFPGAAARSKHRTWPIFRRCACTKGGAQGSCSSATSSSRCRAPSVPKPSSNRSRHYPQTRQGAITGHLLPSVPKLLSICFNRRTTTWSIRRSSIASHHLASSLKPIPCWAFSPIGHRTDMMDTARREIDTGAQPRPAARQHRRADPRSGADGGRRNNHAPRAGTPPG